MRKTESIRWEEVKGAWRREVGAEPEAEGVCVQVRAQVEEANPRYAVPPYGLLPPQARQQDDRVVVFLDDFFPKKESILGWCDPMQEADLLRRFTTLDFTRDAEIVRFYRDFGPVTFPAWDEHFPHPDLGDWLRLGGSRCGG